MRRQRAWCHFSRQTGTHYSQIHLPFRLSLLIAGAFSKNHLGWWGHTIYAIQGKAITKTCITLTLP